MRSARRINRCRERRNLLRKEDVNIERGIADFRELPTGRPVKAFQRANISVPVSSPGAVRRGATWR